MSPSGIRRVTDNVPVFVNISTMPFLAWQPSILARLSEAVQCFEDKWLLIGFALTTQN